LISPFYDEVVYDDMVYGKQFGDDSEFRPCAPSAGMTFSLGAGARITSITRGWLGYAADFDLGGNG